ncbi:MAG: sigma 54-interacting transcriptional regulator, partial [bacterium]
MMKNNIDRLESLVETFAALLVQERRTYQELVTSLIESVKIIQGDTADRRLQRITAQLKKLQERLDLLNEMAQRDFLAKIKHETADLKPGLADGRLATVLAALVEICHAGAGLNRFCECLLDSVIAAAGAERGFVLFYHPESTEADVIAARNFQTTNLSLEEYDFSRTILRETFQRGEPLLLEDASHHPAFSKEISVRKFQLKSILVMPLQQEGRTIGALYLENNTLPCAFDEADKSLLESVARFTVFYLHHSRLLPVLFEQERRIFLDANKASKEIIGQDPKILALQETISRIAGSPATVLIEGESGTGKELVARALHYQSSRRDRPFVTINCAAIPKDLLESELFGHEKGAFTGATERYVGRLEQGNGGTIFLDEVSELAYPLQAKLLRFLQANEFDRLGGKETIRVDVRIVAATSEDLQKLVEAGKFQKALFYRLNVIPVRLPALRERKEDIALLVDHFLGKFCAVYNKNARLEEEVYDWLKEYAFPGNVRELENFIHRLIALATEETIHLHDLPG